MGYLVDSEEEVMVGRSTDCIGAEYKEWREWCGMTKCDGSSNLDCNNQKDDVFGQGFISH